jgi:hypothetical protein
MVDMVGSGKQIAGGPRRFRHSFSMFPPHHQGRADGYHCDDRNNHEAALHGTTLLAAVDCWRQQARYHCYPVTQDSLRFSDI